MIVLKQVVMREAHWAYVRSKVKVSTYMTSCKIYIHGDITQSDHVKK